MNTHQDYERPAAPPENCRWRIFYTVGMPEMDFTGVRLEGNELTLDDGQRITGRPWAFPESGIVEMTEILTPVPPPLSRAVLVCDFESAENATLALGVGVDWFLTLWANGELLCDTRPFGNGEVPIAPDNHICEFDARRGSNQLILLARGGNPSFTVGGAWFAACGLALTHGPWTQFPTVGAVEVCFETSVPTPAGVDWRKIGQPEWTRSYDNLGGQIRRDRAVHRVRLTGLEAECEYEYRAVLLMERRGLREVPTGPVRRFRSASDGESEFSFSAAADWQFGIGERMQIFDRFFSQRAYQDTDFFAFLGDVEWASHFAGQYLDGFVEPYIRSTGGAKPLVMVRGNHEVYGRESNQFWNYFAAPGTGTGYFTFRWGRVWFLVLDCGDDAPRCAYPSTRMLHDIEPYLEAERLWLSRIVEMPECRTAEYRIVLSHAIPAGDACEYLPGHVRHLTDEFFAGEHPRCRIHLWLGGHVHYALRTVPLQNALRSAVPPAVHYPTRNYAPVGVRYPFPVLATSGPDAHNPPELRYSGVRTTVKADGLHVESFDMDGRRFDYVRILPDGEVCEMECADFFKRYEY